MLLVGSLVSLRIEPGKPAGSLWRQERWSTVEQHSRYSRETRWPHLIGSIEWLVGNSEVGRSSGARGTSQCYPSGVSRRSACRPLLPFGSEGRGDGAMMRPLMWLPQVPSSESCPTGVDSELR